LLESRKAGSEVEFSSTEIDSHEPDPGIAPWDQTQFADRRPETAGNAPKTDDFCSSAVKMIE
jgi:hypothetical protein